MVNLSLSSNLDSNALTIPKLHDNRSNWADYEPQIQKVMGAKGLWRHVEGKVLDLKPYNIIGGIAVLADGTTTATEEQIEAKEMRIEDFEKKQYLAQHIILSTTSMRLSSKIKNMKSASKMWDAVKEDITSKITLHIVDAEHQLEDMWLGNLSDPKTHLAELEAHFELMTQRHENLMKMGSSFSDACLATVIMSSLPPLYQPTLQTIAAAKRANQSICMSSSTQTTKKMSPTELIAFFTEEAQHHIIEEDWTKQAKWVLLTHAGKGKSGKGRQLN